MKFIWYYVLDTYVTGTQYGRVGPSLRPMSGVDDWPSDSCLMIPPEGWDCE